MMDKNNTLFFLKNLWLWKCGLPEKQQCNKSQRIDHEFLKLSEWCVEFENYMRNRLLMGAYRYGKLTCSNNYCNNNNCNVSKYNGTKKNYNRIDSIIKRAELYLQNGNDEHLVDIANLVMCEFIEGRHTNKHFESIDDGIHTEAV